MNASELNRKLLFCGYDEVGLFLNDSPLNRHIYKQLIDILPDHHIEVPVVTLFNEVYYQCVRVNFDNTPGIGIAARYFADEEACLHSELAARLVFAIVWAILRSKRSLTFPEECFLDQLEPYVDDGEFCSFAKKLYEQIVTLHLDVPEQFQPMTCPINEVPTISIERLQSMALAYGHIMLSEFEKENFAKKLREWREYNEVWCELTDSFSQSIIEKYVMLYTNPADQLHLLGCIKTSFAREDIWRNVDFVKRLEKKIKAGRKKTGKTASSKGTAKNQTFIMPNVTQFNNNPQTVINQTKEEPQPSGSHQHYGQTDKG